MDRIDLTNGLTIEIAASHLGTVRNYTIVGAICDEIAYWPTDDSANPDVEVLNAIRPGMATVPGALLLCISSPYARRGESTSSSAFETWRIVACDVESVRGAWRAIDPDSLGQSQERERQIQWQSDAQATWACFENYYRNSNLSMATICSTLGYTPAHAVNGTWSVFLGY